VSLVIDEHRQYLNDEVRVDAFARAIAAVVRAGDVVLDLGSGTGFQSLLACRAGARRVYAVDSGSIVSVARSIVGANGFDDRVTFVRGLSTRVALPEPVDVITGDQIGRFGFEAGLLEYFADARDRFLKPGGRIVPESVAMCAAAVELPELAGRVRFWSGRPAGFEFGPMADIAANTGYPAKARPEDVVTPPLRVATLRLDSARPGPLRAAATFQASRDATIHGLAGWFEATLCEGVEMTNSPLAARRIDRAHVFLPLVDPVRVATGDAIGIALHVMPEDHLISWGVSVGGAPRMAQSTLRGMLLSRRDVARSAPAFVPRLTPWGSARRAVLELCDGRRPVADIETAVHERFPSLFRSRSEAATFVAEVIHPYAE
jgi:protein arginine N-methyltransferase 1